ncbi:MAG: glycosyltransferase family 2 protein, partial [Chloroflexi bacterium]|nr:glycosyltransferase family 2 protein [Chloroflexota bacterium]
PDVGWFASKLLLFDRRDVLHSAGDFYGRDGVPGNRGVWERDDGRFDDEQEVFGACGGAALYRRAMLDEVGLFDERLIGYCEDVDLNLRARLAGYRCVFVPAARVYHHLSATGGGPQASYLCGRNFIRVAAKCLPAETWRRHGPRIVAAQLALAAHALWHAREPAARARLRGQLDALRELPDVLRQRAAVGRRARIAPADLERWLAAPSPPPWRPRSRPQPAARATEPNVFR